MFPLFNLLIAPLVPALWLYTLHRRFVRGKSAASYAGQWGHVSPQMREFGRSDGRKIWLHAVSVGETMAARPLARALKAQMPKAKIVLSSTTDSGHEIALSAVQNGEADLAIYFPLDLPFVLRRVLNALNPDAIGFVETELWPNLLHVARRRGIETFQLNGRVSDNLLKSAPRLGPLWKWMRGNISQFQMRGETDAARLQLLGVTYEKIVVVGDVKLEAPPLATAPLRARWRERLGLSEADKVLICGSTHAGEEAFFLQLKREHPELRIALAPRHAERFEEVAALVEKAGLKLTRRSSEQVWESDAIFLLDSVGELSDFYAAGDFAFVGGSLIPRGGHNLLEPVLRGCPVFFGPWVANFEAQRELILQHQFGWQTVDSRLWNQEFARWIADAPRRAEFAARVERVFAPHRGAAARAAQLMARALTNES